MKTYVIVILLACAAVAHAQPAPPAPPEDPIGDRLFPAELIMSHQREIGLDAKTRQAMVEDIQRFQSQAVKLSWDMKAEGETLARLLDAPHPEEAKVLAQADKVMELERQMKRAHLGLLVRLKSRLTPAQQATLRKVRHAGP